MMTRKPWQLPCAGAIVLTLCFLFAGSPCLSAQRAIGGSRAVGPELSASDSGALPASQILTLTLRLNPGTDRTGALDALIAEQIAPGAPLYHKWLTPTEFAASFGATAAQIAAVSAWLESDGLTITAVSPSNLRLTVTGSCAQVEAAFGVHLREYRPASEASGSQLLFFAPAASPKLPAWVAPLVESISGLDNEPPYLSMAVAALASNGVPDAEAPGTDPLKRIEGIVDEDAAPSLMIASRACATEIAPSEVAAWRTVLKQAEAQGITVLANGGCSAGGFPASLPEVTAVVAPDASAAAMSIASAFTGVAPRPEWQFAAGLPAGVWREAPDLAVAGESGAAGQAALAATLATIARRAGTRLGNVAPVLYQLASAPGLFTQPDGAATGVWEESTGLGVVDLKRLAELFPLGSTGTSSLLTVSNYAPYHGQPLTLAATVTSTGGNGVPTGTVTFTSTQKGTLGTATLNAAGVATFTSSSLQAGMYTTTSVYSGDSNYVGSTSGIATITVLGEPSLLTATVEPGAAVGGSATIDVSITSGSGVGTPSGTVTVAPQGTTNPTTATATLAGANGTATAKVPLPVYQAGQFTLLVSCSDPDPSFTCYSPASIQMTVAKGATSTVLSSSPVNPAAGQSYTLTATVAGAGSNAASSSAIRSRGASVLNRGSSGRSAAKPLAATVSIGPTGNVQFMDGTKYLATAEIANGAAMYTGTATSATHSFNAMYSGDGNYATSSSSTPAATGTTPTSTSLTASTYAISVGQNITFYSTIFAAGVPSTMTGTVTFSAATQGVIGTGIVANGLATLTIGTLAAGTYSMTAAYSGDSVFAPSTSTSSVIVTVAPGSATLGGSFTPASVPYGSDAVLTATATFASGSSGPSGSLTATIAGATGGTYTQTLIASTTSPTSTATFSFPAPPPGVYTVTISCPAADTFTCGAPATVPLTVVRGGTATALTLTPAAPLAGQPTTLTATISNTGGDPHTYTFSGTVNFYANNQLLKSAAISGVSASVSVGLPSGAEESITAVYSGDTNWTTSTSAPVVLSVTALPTSTVVASNVTSVLSGVQLLLTATVTDIAGGPLAAAAPSGVVSFYDTLDGVLSGLGTATLVGNGANTSVATLNVAGLAAGTHSIYAVYAGDSVYLGSTSAAITLGSTNYTGTFVPATMTLNQGQTGQASLVVNFQGGFGGTVSFGCTPPPNIELTCSFNPTVLTASGTTTLSVGTVAPSSATAGVRNEAVPPGPLGVRLAGGAALAMLLLCIRRRRLPAVMVVPLALGALLGATGCSGTNLAKSGTPPPVTPTDPGTSLGTHILAITTAGSDGTNTVRHDFQYQVTVQ